MTPSPMPSGVKIICFRDANSGEMALADSAICRCSEERVFGTSKLIRYTTAFFFDLTASREANVECDAFPLDTFLMNRRLGKMNRWGIPQALESEIRRRDKLCVYCHAVMKKHPHARGVPPDKATWEHIDNNDLDPDSENNIVMCCGACNTSKGAKTLLEWFESEYCRSKNINERTVSVVVRKWLKDRKRR